MTDKIKVLFVTDGLGNGGKERQLVETINNLDREKFSAGVLTFNSSQHYSGKVKDISDFFEVIPKDKNIIDPVIASFGIYEKFRPHITHSFDIISAFYTHIPSKIYGCKILNASIQDAGLDKGWQKNLKKRLLLKADCIVSNSFKGLDYYGMKGEVLYNFIDEKRFKEKKADGKFRAAMIASFSKYKDYDFYFRVIRMLIEKNLIDEAYAVGGGDNLDYYRKLVGTFSAHIRDRIVFTGSTEYVEDVLALISIGFLFSTPKYGEGISNSVLEYMSSGTIAIASDIGATREIIEDGDNGFLSDKNDIEKIAGTISRIRSDKEYTDRITKNAQKTIREKFSLQKNIDKLQNIYLRMAGE
ncbi:MAG: glycosyltransferase family 4 protein [Bacteroidetes bacterium]|nr:glycosyltransferase family 4 protein [Bacteroidota bacterium]